MSNKVIKSRWALKDDGGSVIVRFVMKRLSMEKDERDESPRRNIHPLQSHFSVSQFWFHIGSNTSCDGQVANSCKTKSASNLGPRILEQIVEFGLVITPQRAQRRTVELSVGVPVPRLPSRDPVHPAGALLCECRGPTVCGLLAASGGDHWKSVERGRGGFLCF